MTDSYFGATMKPIVDNIIHASSGNPTYQDWFTWIKRWSQFSVDDFLRGSFAQMRLKLQEYDHRHPDDDNPLWTTDLETQLEPLRDLLPWTHDAITAFQARIYTPGIGTSLSEILRDTLGFWWEDPMHTFQGGMISLPRAFMQQGDTGLYEEVRFGATAWKIEYQGDRVAVHYTTDASLGMLPVAISLAQHNVVRGDAAIITPPLNIIRQLNFHPSLNSSISGSIADVYYCPSTKIMLQCKERFWQKEGINGGFSFTDLPISQLHYPTKLRDDQDSDRGILMVYTWKQEALLFGSQSKQSAIQGAINQIKKIHPQIVEHFEVGGVQSWYDDPCAQGAFCMLKPYQIRNTAHQLMYPTGHNKLYFAGEALSYCNGWIQGALESGLRAAYQFYARNEEGLVPLPPPILPK